LQTECKGGSDFAAAGGMRGEIEGKERRAERRKEEG